MADYDPASVSNSFQGSGDRDVGFTLVSVIWGLGLMAFFAVSIMTTLRGRIIATRNFVETAKAEALSDAGINLWRAKFEVDPQAARTRAASMKGAIYCAMSDDATVAIVIEDENGKIDLNSAPVPLLELLVRGLGGIDDEAALVAQSIKAFVRPFNQYDTTSEIAPYEAAGREYGPKRAPFETVLELDQVVGLSPELFRLLQPFVTVHNHQSGFDPRVAPPGLVGLLGGRSDKQMTSPIAALPGAFLALSPHRTYLIHSEVLTSGGGLGARQAIVELASGNEPTVLREFRNVPPRYKAELQRLSKLTLQSPTEQCQ